MLPFLLWVRKLAGCANNGRFVLSNNLTDEIWTKVDGRLTRSGSDASASRSLTSADDPLIALPKMAWGRGATVRHRWSNPSRFHFHSNT